jgi:hypothetical protein
MKINKIKIRPLNASKYGLRCLAEAYKYKGRYYYRVGDTTIEITNTQYTQVIANPHLYYFSTALKLHCLINKKKKIRI